MPGKPLSAAEDTSIVLGIALGLTWAALVFAYAFHCNPRFRGALLGFRDYIVDRWRRHVGIRRGAVFISFQGTPFHDEEPRKLRVAMTPALGAALRDAKLLDGSVAANPNEIAAATMATLELHYDKEPLKKASHEASFDSAPTEVPARKKPQKKAKKSRHRSSVADGEHELGQQQEEEEEEEEEEWNL